MNPAALMALCDAQTAIKESVDDAGKRLRAIWNPETKSYEPHDQMVLLHDAINDGLVAYQRIKKMRAALEKVAV